MYANSSPLGEVEPNDQFLSVNSATAFGTELSARLSGSSDIDFFRFLPSSPSLVEVRFSADDGGAMRFELALFKADGTPVEGSMQTVQGSDTLLFYADETTGGIYLRVNAAASESATEPFEDGSTEAPIDTPYVFTANSFPYAAPNTEQEPNDYFADPLASETNAPITGTVTSSADEDWFYVDIDAASTVSFAVLLAQIPSANTKPLYAAVYGAEGEFLTGRDLTEQNNVVTFTVEQPGSVFLALTPGETFQAAVAYSIATTIDPIDILYPAPPAGPGETPQTTAITAGARVMGAVYAQGAASSGASTYSFSVPAAGTVAPGVDLNFDPTTDLPDKHIFLIELSHNGKVVETISTGEDVSIALADYGAGDYLFKVAPGPDAPDMATFGLTVSVPPSSFEIAPATWTGFASNDVFPGSSQAANANADRLDPAGGSDLIDGGAGSDTAIFRVAANALTIQSVEGITAVTGGYNADAYAYKTTRLVNVERIETLSGALDLPPAPAISPIFGKSLEDQDYGYERIVGTAGSDVIDGRGGSAFIDGAGGTDTAVVLAKRNTFDIQSTAGVTLLIAASPTPENTQDFNEYHLGIQVLTQIEKLAFLPDASDAGNDTVALEVSPDQRVIRFGTSGDDNRLSRQNLIGTEQSELFVPLWGQDEIDGGTGNDALLLFGPSAMYDVTTAGAITTVRAKAIAGSQLSERYVQDSVFTLTRVEKIVFADGEQNISQVAGITLLASETVVTEGATLPVSVVLDSAPTADVTIELTSSVPGELGFGNPAAPAATAQVTFTPANWNTAQPVTIAAGPDDAQPEAAKGVTVSAAAKTGTYAATSSTLALRILDNDSAKQSVTGKVFEDTNGDGASQTSEPGLVGWKVFADANRNGKIDTGEPQAVSDAQGDYRLLDLPIGQVVVMAEIPTGWARSAPGARSNSGAVVIEHTGEPGRADAPIPTGSVEILSGGATGNAPPAGSPYANLGLRQKIAEFHTQFPAFTGKGYTTVVIDTGADLDHGDFGIASPKNSVMVANRIVYQYDFVGANDADANETPDGGHGTHVAGTIVSSNPNFLGMAPEANLIVLKVLGVGGSGSGRDIIEAVDWVVANGKQYNVVSVNMSLGDSSWSSTPMQGYLNTQFEALAKQGIVVLAASGNSYEERSGNDPGVGYPSSDSWAMSIGSVIAGAPGTPNASDDSRPIDTLSSFSQRGPLTVAVAPGDKIGAAWLDNGHAYIQGTSMATPEVSGTVLLMQQMADTYLNRRLTWEEVKTVLQKTGESVVDTQANMQDGTLGNTGLTYKRINLLNIEAEIKGMLKSPDASTVTLGSGETATLNLGFGRAGTTMGTLSANKIYGSSGDEQVDAGGGDDEVNLGEGNDQAEGGQGDDEIRADDGSDSLDGGQGNDTLLVEGDDNSLTGGEGKDRFVFENPSGENRITDFTSDDTLIIRTGADTATADPQTLTVESIEPGTGNGLALGSAHFAYIDGELRLAVGLNNTPGADATFIFSGAPASTQFITAAGGGITILASGVPEANDRINPDSAIVEFGKEAGGDAKAGGDRDLYRLKIDESGLVGIDLRRDPQAAGLLEVALVDAGGSPLPDSEYQIESDESLLFFVEAPGDYFLQFNGAGNESGGVYRFTPSFFDLSAPGREQEPNDLYADPLDSTSGASMQGALSKADDKDWFSIDTTAAATIIFDVVLTSAPTAGVSPLYLSVQSDGGEVLASRDVTATNTAIEVELASAGTVFLALTRGESPFSSPVSYTITTRVTQAEVISADPSLPGDAPQPLPRDGQVSGTAAPGSQSKFTFTLGANESSGLRLDFDAKVEDEERDLWHLQLRRGDAVVEDIQTGADVSVALAPLGAGVYTLTVATGTEAEAPAQYLLKLDVPPAGSNGAAATWTGSKAADMFPATSSANAGADRLDGAGGDDQLDGGAGKDTAIFKVAASSLSIQSIAGLTAVSGNYDAGPYAFTSARLWNIESVETLDGPIDLPPSPAIKPVIGSEARDIPSESLKGGPDNDVIDARGGFDTVDGGSGTDTLVLFAKRSAFSVDTLAGITTIRDSSEAAKSPANSYHQSHVVATGIERIAFLADTRDSRSDELTLPLTPAGRSLRLGTAKDDRLVGDAGDETFYTQAGQDTIDGGAGNDLLVLFGRKADYEIASQGGSVTVRQKDSVGSTQPDTWTLSRVERILFSDGEQAVDQARAVSLSVPDTVITEGGTSTLHVVLDVKPATPVTVTVTSSAPGALGFGTVGSPTASPTASATVSFTPENWDEPKPLALAARPENSTQEVTGTATLTATVTQGAYAVAPSATTLKILDNDGDRQKVTGKVFNDLNGDGTRQTGEAGLVGWKVFADSNSNGKIDTGEPQALSDDQGDYSLVDLPIGKVVVMAETPTGWARSAPGARSNSGAVVIERTGDSGRVDTPIAAGSVEILSGGATGNAPPAPAGSYANLGLAQKIAQFHAEFPKFTGKGYTAVVIDTGADLDHGDFGIASSKNSVMVANRIVYQYDFVGANDADANEPDHPSSGHGTHVAGTIASSNPNFLGMAPEANLIVFRVLDVEGGSDNDILEAVNWVVENGKKYNVVSVNMSLGSDTWDREIVDGLYATQFEALAKQGIVTLVAAGNSFEPSEDKKLGVGAPASERWAMAIGSVVAGEPGTPNASDDNPSLPIDTISSFSQRGPLIVAVAPGDKIGAAYPNDKHAYISGTSMATPEVAGTVLLMQQMADEYLGRRLTWEEVKDVLKTTGETVTDSAAGTGSYRRINLLQIEAKIKGILKSPDATSVDLAKNETETLDLGFMAATPTVGTDSANEIIGSRSDEQVDAGGGDDSVDGGGGEDEIAGGEGDDELRASDGDDTIDGGEGNDRIEVEGGDNNLSGGEGDDAFVLNSPEGTNVISDFSGDDYIDFNLSDSAVASQSAGEPKAIPVGTGTNLGFGAFQAQRVNNDVILHLGTDANAGSDTSVRLANVPASASFSVDATGVVRMTVGAEPLGATGKAYHWKSHTLLDDVTVQTRQAPDTLAPTPATRAPIEFRNAQADASGKLTAELWVRSDSDTGSLMFDFAFGQGSTFNFNTSAGAIGPNWTSIGNPIGTTGHSWSWMGNLGSQNLQAGEHRIGDITVDAPTGARPWLQLVDAEVGTKAIASMGLAVTDRQGVYALQPQEAKALLLEIGAATPTVKAVTASDALATLKLSVGRNPNASVTPDAAPIDVSPYQLLSADIDRNGKVTAADALNVLKMAIGRTDAPSASWAFILESADLWNEATQSFSVTRKAVPTNISTAVIDSPTKAVNWVGFISGDVDGSWRAPSQAGIEAPHLPEAYFRTLADSMQVPEYQFGFHG